MRAREMPLNLDATCILHIVIQKIKDLLKVLYFYLNPSDYPPKLSNMIMSSSTPKEWSKSSTVLDIIGGPRRKWLARRNSHTSLACRTSSSPQKLKIFGGPTYYGYLSGSSPMKKTVFDLLHSLDIKIQYIQ